MVQVSPGSLADGLLAKCTIHDPELAHLPDAVGGERPFTGSQDGTRTEPLEKIGEALTIRFIKGREPAQIPPLRGEIDDVVAGRGNAELDIHDEIERPAIAGGPPVDG